MSGDAPARASRVQARSATTSSAASQLLSSVSRTPHARSLLLGPTFAHLSLLSLFSADPSVHAASDHAGVALDPDAAAAASAALAFVEAAEVAGAHAGARTAALADGLSARIATASGTAAALTTAATVFETAVSSAGAGAGAGAGADEGAGAQNTASAAAALRAAAAAHEAAGSRLRHEISSSGITLSDAGVCAAGGAALALRAERAAWNTARATVAPPLAQGFDVPDPIPPPPALPGPALSPCTPLPGLAPTPVSDWLALVGARASTAVEATVTPAAALADAPRSASVREPTAVTLLADAATAMLLNVLAGVLAVARSPASLPPLAVNTLFADARAAALSGAAGASTPQPSPPPARSLSAREVLGYVAALAAARGVAIETTAPPPAPPAPQSSPLVTRATVKEFLRLQLHGNGVGGDAERPRRGAQLSKAQMPPTMAAGGESMLARGKRRLGADAAGGVGSDATDVPDEAAAAAAALAEGGGGKRLRVPDAVAILEGLRKLAPPLGSHPRAAEWIAAGYARAAALDAAAPT